VLDAGPSVAAACPNQPALREFIRGWAEAAVDTGAERRFWDEPHWPPSVSHGAALGSLELSVQPLPGFEDRTSPSG
jgi:hypothetical protein